MIKELKQIKQIAESDKSIPPINRQELIYEIDIAIIHLSYELDRKRLLTYLTIAKEIAVERTFAAVIVSRIDSIINALSS